MLAKEEVPQGLRQGQMVSRQGREYCFSALGGDCLEDMERLWEDEGLEALLGYKPPAVETARRWLDWFHDDSLMAQGLPSRFIEILQSPMTVVRDT